MRDNVDYRLVERFRAKRLLHQPPPAQQPEQKRATAEQQRLPAIGLRD
jgi:hypothetical protein